MRLFAAIVPPGDALRHLETVVTPVRDDHLTWTLIDSWHVTLAFYGEVDETRLPELSRRLQRAANRYQAMSLRLAGAGRFGRSVLWAGVEGDVDVLKRLAASSSASGRRVGLDVPEPRRYRPHVTLARASQQRDLRPYVEMLRPLAGPHWTAVEMALVRSHLGAGPGRRSRYETLATFPLAS